MVRRWTGGGIVPHGEDLTYSIMIGSNHDTFSLPSKIVYQRVHAALSGALREIGIATVLTEANAPKLSEACFANPVVSDVIENGRKIAGAAQRKTRSGLLHQGSIQRQNLNGKFRSIFGKLLTKRLITNSIEMGVLGTAEELAVAKYATTHGCAAVDCPSPTRWWRSPNHRLFGRSGSRERNNRSLFLCPTCPLKR